MNENKTAKTPADGEPVAWIYGRPAYYAPPKREWVGLTEYQRLKFADRFHISGESIEAIEAKLKDKNG